MGYLLFRTVLSAVITFFAIFPINGNFVQNTSRILSQMDDQLSSSNDRHSQNIKNISGCVTKVFDTADVIFFDNGGLLIKPENITVLPDNYQNKDGEITICIPIKSSFKLTCKEKFEYESNEYYIYPNNSAQVGIALITEKNYEFDGDMLLICAPSEEQKANIYIGQIGSGISIIALMIHLITFLYLPSLRNLHGYNLASLSLAFMLAYSFVLIGQIPQVLGLSCVISGILQQNFFLAAFFCMNVLAFDVWRMLKLASEQLYSEPRHSRQKKFVWYSLYAWGVPLLITSISVIVDNVKGVPIEIKPDYGKDDICWMGHKLSKAIFFALPVFTLIIVNAIFFFMTACILYRHKMDCSKDMKRHAAKNNFVLYVKLGLMMGLTWLVGIVALISQIYIIWLIFDVLNSLQGLFLFLLFTCNRKVANKIVEKTSTLNMYSKKSTATTSVSTKNHFERY